MEFLALETAGDVVTVFVEWVLPVLAIVLLTALLMWLLAYMTRYFEYLKAQENKWFTRDTFDFMRKFFSLCAVIFYFLGVLIVLQYRSGAARDILAAVIAHVPAAFLVLFSLFLGAVFVRVLHNFAAYLRGELRVKPKSPAPPRALVTTELALKYVVFAIAGVTAFVGGVQALPAQDQVVKDALSGLIRPEQWSSALLILAGAVVLLVVLDRVASSLFEDLKKRSVKFNAKVIDQLKSAMRVAMVLVIGVAALFLLLNLVLDATRLLVFAVGFIALVVVASFAGMQSFQEAIAGVNLMMADPFDVGDRVKIGDDLVCDVAGIYLTMTQVRTLRGELISLPNTRLRQEPILNFSRSEAYAMFVEVSVPFAVPHARVQDVLLEAARKTRGIVETPPPEVHGKDVAGSSIEYQLLAYTKEPERMKRIKSDLVFNLQDAFQKFGIVPGVSSG
ncbi:MAG: mechanosensitive ion channel [Methanobacteriota archaeon]|nr:MAG: mechanosensitive ion channel [Euryarchaeota archaeon]